MRSGVTTDGEEVVVVGRSNLVASPSPTCFSREAKGANATVTVCHTATKDLASHTKRADILIVAAVRPQGDYRRYGERGRGGHRRGRQPDRHDPRRQGQARGDVDFEAVKEKAALITPVPGRGRADDDHHADAEHGEGREVSPRASFKEDVFHGRLHVRGKGGLRGQKR